MLLQLPTTGHNVSSGPPLRKLSLFSKALRPAEVQKSLRQHTWRSKMGQCIGGFDHSHSIVTLEVINRRATKQAPLIVLLLRETMDPTEKVTLAGTCSARPICQQVFTANDIRCTSTTAKQARPRKNGQTAGSAASLDSSYFSLHIFGFGCPAGASLQTMCRYESVVRLAYPAAFLRNLEGIEKYHGILVGEEGGHLHTYAVSSCGRGRNIHSLFPIQSFLGSASRVKELRLRATVLCISSLILPDGDTVLCLGCADGTVILFRLKGGLSTPTPPLYWATPCDGPVVALNLWQSQGFTFRTPAPTSSLPLWELQEREPKADPKQFRVHLLIVGVVGWAAVHEDVLTGGMQHGVVILSCGIGGVLCAAVAQALVERQPPRATREAHHIVGFQPMYMLLGTSSSQLFIYIVTDARTRGLVRAPRMSIGLPFGTSGHLHWELHSVCLLCGPVVSVSVHSVHGMWASTNSPSAGRFESNCSSIHLLRRGAVNVAAALLGGLKALVESNFTVR